MSDPRRLELITEVARLYYEKDMNVKEIGKVFDISPSSVSRLLKEAKENKIVEIVIRYPFLSMPSLGLHLQERFGLKEAHVLPDFSGAYQELNVRLGNLAARVLEQHLDNDMTLGISLGLAVSNTARAFYMARRLRCRVIRLQGANDNELAEGTDLAQIFSAQLGGEFKILPSPWVMQTKEACDVIMQEPTIKDLIRQAESVDIALVGVGTMDASISTLLRNRLITPEEFTRMRRAGAVGEIFGLHYDRDGKQLDVDFNQRIVSMALDKLRQIDTVIGVAASPGKVDAILGALRGKLINVLVTDAAAARLLLERSAA